ncbi:MAG: HlyD family efflux transporter periplasmic adaptor subunit [Bacteroidota bacterium]
MDRVIEKKTWTKKRILTIIGIAGIVGLAAASYYFTSGKSRLNVDTERIAISEVKKGVFQENIPVNGVVLPLTSIFLETQEGGQVEERFVEDGTIMKKGQPIVRLSNTNLLMSTMNQQNTVFNTLTQMQINRNAAQQNTVNKLTQMADVESQYKEAERIYNLNKKLYDQKAIGLQEFKKSENDFNYYSQKRELARQILKADTVSTKQQMVQDKQSYEGSQNALAIMKKKVEDLIVKSPVDGQLTSLDAEVGQTKTPGARIGQIDVLSGFKVRVDVDEHYLSRIYTGLKGTFTFADTLYNLEIQKVYTQVTNGRFQVDMVFKGKVPKGIRRGQTLQILVSLSEAKQALLLPKGGFYQQTGGNWIFKVNENGTLAYRVDIQLGNQNTDYYEVLNGLQPGDKVVTSSYENYGTMQELVLKK